MARQLFDLDVREELYSTICGGRSMIELDVLGTCLLLQAFCTDIAD